MRIFTCRYRDWTIGRGLSGTTLAEISQDSGTFSPKIDWVLVGVDERWRENLKTIFRKRSGRPKADREQMEVA